MNYFLREFYNDVKDPSWPDIETYNDYSRLPMHIRQECEQQHNLIGRLNEIEDPLYWGNLTQVGYKYKNLVYVPIGKCASMFYMNLFVDQLNWQRVCNFSTLDKDTVLFGVVMEPTKRWLKGMAEWIYQYVQRYDDEILKNLMSQIVIPDCSHTLPYSVMLDGWLEKANWIPMDLLSTTQTKQSMMALFRKHGHNIDLPLDDEKIHVSSPEKLEVYNKIKQLHIQNFNNRQSNVYMLSKLLAQDLKFYRNLVNNFDPTFGNPQ